MQFATCVVAAAAITREAAYSAEMTSQLVYGEKCAILGEESGKWWHICNRFDGYEGYVMKSQLALVEEAVYEQPATCFTRSLFGVLQQGGGEMVLPAGAYLDAADRNAYRGDIIDTTGQIPTAAMLEQLALLFLHTPYLWGGKTPFGLDCSGFTQTIYRLLGFALPRDAWQQAGAGTDIGFLLETRTGDLAFFDDAEGRIIHVGILLGPAQIIHAAGKVRIDNIDHLGILHAQTGERTHKLRVIKRYLEL